MTGNIMKLANPLGDDRTTPLILTAHRAMEDGDAEAAGSALAQFVKIQARRLEVATPGSIYDISPTYRGAHHWYASTTINYANALRREISGGKAVTDTESESLAIAEKRMLVAVYTSELDAA